MSFDGRNSCFSQETFFLLLVPVFFFLSFIVSCLFSGWSYTDIGRGSSIGVKPTHFLLLLLFLFWFSSLIFDGGVFLRFFNAFFVVLLFPSLCFVSSVSSNFFLTSSSKPSCFSSSSLISSCFSVFL